MRSELVQVERLAVAAAGAAAPIVRDVSFNIRRGEVLALIGETGSGKTTVALAMLGYARAGCRIRSGKVRIAGVDVLNLSAEERREFRGRRVAYMAQSAAAAFNPALTIGEQVTESAVLHEIMTQAEADACALDLYRRLQLPDPEHLGARYPHQVSGGQLQRLMMAMALCSGPDLLVLDEPTSFLDATTQIEVLRAFNEIIRDQGTAAIYVSHDLAVVMQIADRITVLYDGQVVESGDSHQIVSAPGHDYTRAMMAAIRPSPGSATFSRTVADSPERDTRILAVDNVTAGYGPASPVLHEVSVEIRTGSVVGMIGESGCGKSTLARVVAGLLPGYEGRVVLDEFALPERVEERRLDDVRRVQIAFQMADVALNPRQRVDEIIGRPLELYMNMKGRAKAARIVELLEMVELSQQFVTRYPQQLSGGQKQRVNLARALAADPEVIICDEVTSGLDTIVSSAVISLLERLRREIGVSYLFISHDISTVALFADRIVVLYAGRVVESGPTAEVLSPPHHPYTRLLLSSIPELRRGWLDEVTGSREVVAAMDRGVIPRESGCPFFDRCLLRIPGVCEKRAVPDRVPASGHRIACHRELTELSARS